MDDLAEYAVSHAAELAELDARARAAKAAEVAKCN
jgi:hypothetical protein